MPEYSAKITDVKKDLIISDNKPFLDVCFLILLDGETVAERRLAFPLDAAEETILSEVKKNVAMYQNDHELAAEAAKRSETEAQADGVISSLVGKEV